MNEMKALQEAVYENAVEKGFWDCPHCDGEARRPKHDRYCETCESSGRHRNDGESIALIHSELSEALECLRDGTARDYSAKAKYEPGLVGTASSEHLTNLAEELADVVIRVMDLAESKGIDLHKAINWKHQYNQGRPHKHGKQF